MWPGEVVKYLKEDNLLPEVFSFLTEAQGFSLQGSEGLSDCQVESFQQSSTDLEALSGQPLCSTLYAVADANQAPLLLFLNYLRCEPTTWISNYPVTGL